jgi:diguanylate cyclase (GGDEF)-like protein/PAS domain S-box-containing protein
MAAASAAGVPFLPDDVPSSVRWTLALLSIGATFVGVLLLAGSISNELRRLKTLADNTLYRALMEAFPEPLNAKDMEGRFIAANSATARLMLAGSASELIGKTDFDFYPPEVASAFRKDEEAVLAAHRPAIIEQHVARMDDSTAWISTLKVPLIGPGGEETGLLTHNRDISELKRLRDDRERAHARLNDALASMADAIAVFDGENRLVLCNELYRLTFPKTAALRVPGAALGDLLRAALEEGDIVGIEGDDRDAWIADMLADRRSHRQHLLWLGDGRVVSVRIRPGSEETSVVVISDVTEEHRGREQLAEMNRQLVDLARTDSLTGVANRRVFDETQAAELRRRSRTGSPISLLMLDIDHFKAFNDAHGHLAGDACLRQVARAMTQILKRPGDVIARYGGEEFAVILADTDADGALAAAERLRREIEELTIPTPTGPAARVTISIGVATASGGVEVEPAALIGAADRGLYKAKSGGRNRTATGALDENVLRDVGAMRR